MWSIQLFPHALHPQLSPLCSLDKTHIVVHADIVMPIFLTLPYKSRLYIECKVFTCSKTVEKAAQFIPDSSEHGVLPTRLSALQKLPWWLVQCWKTLIFPPVLHSFSTLLWCLCMWGPPSRAAVRSSGPFSSASHSRAATEPSAPLWNGCFPPRGSKLKRGRSTPRSRRTLHRTEVRWPRRDNRDGSADVWSLLASTWLR